MSSVTDDSLTFLLLIDTVDRPSSRMGNRKSGDFSGIYICY